MYRSDIEALGELAGDLLAAGPTVARDMHAGIAGRPFAVLGEPAAPVRLIHDGVARAAYGGVRWMLRAGARGGARVAAVAAGAEGDALESRPRASIALGALNGIYGDHLASRGSGLALAMRIRRHGREVTATSPALAAAFPDATSRIVLFLHGLGETDEAWHLRPRAYGERLQDELGLTPVYLRYNSGLHVSQNGRALAALLEDLVAGWPVGVEELVLVGHSMGGLVARSACHYGSREEHRWTARVRRVFCLGTPHLGADLEKAVNVLGWALDRLPETQALATVLNARSAGIKDLRFGSCIDEDWSDRDPDEFLRDRCHEVPFLPDVSYYFVAASLGRGPLGTALGDLLVRLPSASGRGSGRGRRVTFELGHGREFAGLSHFDLLNDEAVYEQLRAWIRRPTARLARADPAGLRRKV